MSWNPPINSWPQRDEFRKLLQRLEQLGAPSRFKTMAATSRENFNFYCSAGPIEAAFQNWFFEKYNTQTQAFAWSIWRMLQENIPQSNSLIEAIESSGFLDVFQPSTRPTSMSRALPAAQEPTSYLHAHLNNVVCARDASKERKDAAIEMVLNRAETNNYLRGLLPWLLPGKTTLGDIVKNCSSNWHPLVTALCEVAERATAVMYTSFPVLNTRQAVEEAVQQIRLPFHEQIMYNPLVNAETRAAIWMASAPKAIQQVDLCTWLGEFAMINVPMSQEQMNMAFADLMYRMETLPALCNEVVQHVRAKNLFPVTHFETLVKDLFTPKAPVTTLPPMEFIERSWVTSILNAHHIVNSAVEKHLRELEAESELLSYYNQESMPPQLMAWGATGLEHVRITNAMVKAGLIAPKPTN